MRLAILVFLAASTAHAADPTAPLPAPPEPKVYTPYTLRLDVDLSLLIGGLALWGGTSLIGGGGAPPSWCGTAATPPCDANSVNALDQIAIGRYNHSAKV